MIEYIKSLRWTDYFFLCLFDPRRLVNLIGKREGNPFLLGLLIVFVVSLFEIISLSLFGTENYFFYYKISYGWILVFIIVFLKIIIFSSLVDLFCQFREHPGSIMKIINLVCFSFFPLIFLLPVVVIATTLNIVPIVFFILVTILLHFWQAMIIIQGISEIYQMGFGESLVMFLSPILFIGLITLFIIILFFINFGGFISSL